MRAESAQPAPPLDHFMILSKSLGRIPGFLPETQIFAQQFVGSNGTIAQETLQAIDRFVRDCYYTGVWTKLWEIYPFVGNSINGAMVKLKFVSVNAMTGVNLVSADYTERGANGGIAGNGSTKYIDTNFAADTLPANAHISVYLREDVPAITQYLIGVNNSGATDIAGIAVTAATNTFGVLGKSLTATEVASPVKGFLYTERQSATDLKLYRNNTQIATQTTNITPAYPPINFFVGARNNFGAATSFGNKKISFVSLGLPLTAQERTDFYNAVQNLQANLQRNV
jgi:hypothetical protein